ncbi:MAG: FkbM family methyltransferase [Halioglobus sp.]
MITKKSLKLAMQKVFRQKDNISRIINHPLNQNARFRAFFRWLVWQTIVRFSRSVSVSFVGNTFLTGSFSNVGVSYTYYFGLYEYRDMRLMASLLRGEDLFIDVGANIGLYSILISSIQNSKVAAFEPVPSTYSMLKSNVINNNLSDAVDCFCLAVGKDKGRVQLTCDLDVGNKITTNYGKGAISIDQIDLDSGICIENYNKIFLKIDVEGFEFEVLLGAREILSNENCAAVLLEINSQSLSRGFDDCAIIVMLEEYGFHPYDYVYSTNDLRKLDRASNYSDNTLFIKDPNFIRERLNSADISIEFQPKIKKIVW